MVLFLLGLDHSPARNPPSSGLWTHVLSWIPFYLPSSLFSGLLPHPFPSTDSHKCYIQLIPTNAIPHGSGHSTVSWWCSSSPMTFASISIIIHCQETPKSRKSGPYFLSLKPHRQLQPHVSIYISLDLTLQLSKIKLILSLIGLQHPGSGPQHFTSASLQLPHYLPAPNFPALGFMSSTWLYIVIETSKLIRSLLCSKSSEESHLLQHEIYILDRMEKSLLTLLPVGISSFCSCFYLNARDAPKANNSSRALQHLHGLSNTSDSENVSHSC